MYHASTQSEALQDTAVRCSSRWSPSSLNKHFFSLYCVPDPLRSCQTRVRLVWPQQRRSTGHTSTELLSLSSRGQRANMRMSRCFPFGPGSLAPASCLGCQRPRGLVNPGIVLQTLLGLLPRSNPVSSLSGARWNVYISPPGRGPLAMRELVARVQAATSWDCISFLWDTVNLSWVTNNMSPCVVYLYVPHIEYGGGERAN